MSELSDLYQEVILDHNRSPRNFKKLDHADRKADGYNPLCGDQITVYVKLENGVIREVSFQGSGCAISKASASMMTASLEGKTVDQAEAMFDRVHRMLTGGSSPAVDAQELGKLAALSGVSNFPARVKCATLSWHTLRSALKGEPRVASTE